MPHHQRQPAAGVSKAPAGGRSGPLNISLDTLRAERFREITRRGDLEDAFAGIRAAEDAGFQNLKLDTVLMGGVNDDEIEDFLNLTKEHPWEVRFIELMPMGPCAAWPKERFLP